MNIINYNIEFMIEEEKFLEYTICFCGEMLHIDELYQHAQDCDYLDREHFIYAQLSLAERNAIAKHYDEGLSMREIGRKISRSHTTVSREIKRNGDLNQPSLAAKRKGTKTYRYTASKAHKRALKKVFKIDKASKYEYFYKWFEKNVRNDLSLDAHLMNFEKEFGKTHPSPCTKTLYNWYHSGIISYKHDVKMVKKYRKKVKGEAVDGRKSIHQRYEDFGFDMFDYSVPGHYEIDTIYDGDKKGGVLTLNHRATMTLHAVIIPDRKATTVNKALRKLILEIGPHNILSITSDNGREFYYTAVIENSYDIKWYYCDPYKSGQRGQNERLNRDIRKYFGKGCLFHNVDNDLFEYRINLINNFPRKKFDGRSAIEQSFEIKRTNFN